MDIKVSNSATKQRLLQHKLPDYDSDCQIVCVDETSVLPGPDLKQHGMGKIPLKKQQVSTPSAYDRDLLDDFISSRSPERKPNLLAAAIVG